MRSAGVATVFVAVAGLLYGLPTLLEFLLEPHIGALASGVLLGNLLGCAALYFLGYRRTAIGCYIVMGAVGWLLLRDAVTPAHVIWLADTVPSLLAAWFVSRSLRGIFDEVDAT